MDKVEEAVLRAYNERWAAHVVQVNRRRAIEYGVCPGCAGALKPVSGALRRVVNALRYQEELECTTCSEVYRRNFSED